MTYIPQYFGNNFRMFFLDDVKGDLNLADNSDNNVLIIQGVNILGTADKHSVVYSRRGLELGGGLEKSTSEYADSKGATTRNVNSNIDGMSFGTAVIHYPNYFGITTRYSQIIYNTDIVLRTPNGAATPRSSRIYDASLPYDGEYYNSHDISDETNKLFNPTVKIIGGNIFVGKGQTLRIDGGRFNYNPTIINGIPLKNPDNSTKYITTRTMTVSPSSLTVEQGGVVNIGKPVAKNFTDPTKDAWAASPYANVTTDMFVNGKVNLTTGAWAGGNVVVGNNAEMTIADTARYDGNIYVEEGGTLTIGASTIVGDIQIRKDGKVTIGADANITGDVRCAGELEIKGDITLNATVPAADNSSTKDINESLPDGKGNYIYHGIFIYDDPSVGTGTLKLTGIPKITGNSGKIHSFVSYPDIANNENKTFCYDHSENNVCRHWTSDAEIWQVQNGEIPGE
jgi:hypothetical protein